MSIEHNTSGVFVLLFSLDFKFVNSFQYNSENCNSYVRLLRMLSTDLQLIIIEIL
jgi:hypothetical protein